MNTEQNLPIFLHVSAAKVLYEYLKMTFKVKHHVFVVAQFLFGKSRKCTC